MTKNKYIHRYNVQLNIPVDIYEKIMFWVNMSDYEVSWWGLLDYEKDTNIFTVKEVFLLEQEVSRAETEISATAMHKIMFETRDSPYKLRWWGHSHANMDVFWSGTDVETMMVNSQGGWLLSTVFNKKRELKTAFITDIPASLYIDNVPTNIITPHNQDWEKEYREKVKVKTYKSKKIDPYDKNPAYKELTKKSKEEEDLFERIYNKPNGKKQEKTYKKGPKSEKDLIEEFVNSVADDDSITIDDMNNWLAWQGGNFSED